jgi:hypothetical protein
MSKALLFAALVGAAQAANSTRILIMGDSWGTVSPATKYFQKELKAHDCPLGGFSNIAIGGTTAKQWSAAAKMKEVEIEAAKHDFVWVTLMGNDARAVMPDCAKTGKTAEQCGDLFIEEAMGYMTTIVDGIHKANPEAQIVGFGYDIMFGGLGCTAAAQSIIPQCWKGEKNYTNPVECFNTQIIRIQHDVWDKLAAAKSWVTAIDMLGATQIAGGDKKATIGHPDLEKMGPAKYWPLTNGCFHPGEPAGAEIIMGQFYDQFWSKALSC